LLWCGLVAQPRAWLSFSLGISMLITFWSAATGTKSVQSCWEPS
jgi:hypothetical protein